MLVNVKFFKKIFLNDSKVKLYEAAIGEKKEIKKIHLYFFQMESLMYMIIVQLALLQTKNLTTFLYIVS